MPLSLQVLDADDLDRLVEPRSLVDYTARILASPPTYAPRSSVETASWLGLMAAAGDGFQAVKIVGVYPGNPPRGLPLVRGLALLLDEETGEPLLAADAAPLTGWRTAAATAVALEQLSATRGVLGIIGAGVQADYHLRLLTRLYNWSSILLHSRRREKAARLAARHGATPVDSLEKLLLEADVVLATTNSEKPVVRAEHLHTGATVASIGAPKPVRELDTRTLLDARCVLVDTRRGVAEESGDVDAGVVELVELGELLRGEKRCIHGRVAVYKSVGTPVLDYAILRYLYDALRAP